jgi:hypothetical protein
MIVCRQCGNRNEDGAAFCSNCGSFLEFTGERVADPPQAAAPANAAPQAPPPPPSPQPAPAPHGLIDRVKAAVRGEPGTSDDEGEPSVAVTSTVSPRRRATAIEAAPPEVALTGRPVPALTAPSPPTGAPPSPAPPSAAAAAAAPPPSPAAMPATPSAPAAPERQVPGGETIAGPPPAGAAPPVTAPPAAATSSPPAAPPPTAPIAPAAIQPSPVVSPHPAAPVAQQPVAQQPAPARPRPGHRPVAAPPPPGADADDIVCPRCGERSARDRRFCRRCGTSLVTVAEPPPPPRPPWWRRLLAHLRRPPAEDAPGTGSRKPSALRRLVDLGRHRPGLLALAAVVLLVIGLNPAWRAQVTGVPARVAADVRRTIAPTFVPVNATGAVANAAVPGHPAALAVDGLKDTYWAAPEGTSEATWPTLTVTLGRAADLDKIGFTAGASADPRAFLALPRPHDVHLVFSDGSTTDLQLRDVRDFQPLDVTAHRVTSVQIQIRSVWPGQTATTVALAEVEFFERQ